MLHSRFTETASIMVVMVMIVLSVAGAAQGAPGSSSPFPTAPPTGLVPAQAAPQGAITFDDLPAGTSVTDQYAAVGVIFSGPTMTTADGANPTSPVLSGVPQFVGVIRGTFTVPGTSQPATVFGFDLDVGFIDNRNSVEVRYFGTDGARLGDLRAQSLGINALSVRHNGIASFEVRIISDEPAGFGIDNLVIVREPAGVAVRRVAIVGDSYISGEGLLPDRGDRYDCGTDLHRNSYIERTTLLPWFQWRDGVDCSFAPPGSERPADLYEREIVTYENLCHRAGTSYGWRIGQSLGVADGAALFVACSGAQMTNLGVRADPGDAASVIAGTEVQYADSPRGLHGGMLQFDNVRDAVVTGGAFDLILISIGGNDTGFGAIIRKCIQGPCVGRNGLGVGTDVRAETIDRIDREVYPNLVTTFQHARSEFAPATIAVFGYPTIVRSDLERCGALHLSRYGGAGISQDELVWLADTLLPHLNQTIEEAAQRAGVTFIDTAQVTREHALCSQAPWFQGLVGGDDKARVLGNESFHPTQDAHAAIHEHFIAGYTSAGRLTFTNPAPQAPIRPALFDGIPLAVGTLTGQIVSPCGPNGCEVQDVCVVNGCALDLQGGGFLPNTPLTVTALPIGPGTVTIPGGSPQLTEPQPTPIGSVTADDRGRFDVRLTVPGVLAPDVYLIGVDAPGESSIQFGSTVIAVDPPESTPALRPGRAIIAPAGWIRDGLRVRVTCDAGGWAPCSARIQLRPARAGAAIAARAVTNTQVGASRTILLKPRPDTAAARRLAAARATLRSRRAEVRRARGPVALRRARSRAAAAQAKVTTALRARRTVIARNRALVVRLRSRAVTVRLVDPVSGDQTLRVAAAPLPPRPVRSGPRSGGRR